MSGTPPPDGISCLGHDRTRHFRSPSEGAKSKIKAKAYGQVHRTNGPSQLALSMFTSAEARAQLFSTFMESFFAPNPRINANDDSFYLLMANFPYMAGRSGLFDRSVIALAALYLGKKGNDKALTYHGIEIYASALRAMSNAIRQYRPQTLMLLLTSIVFHTYETIHNSDDSLQNCFTHIRGGSALVMHCSQRLNDTSHNRLADALLIRQKWATSFFILNAHNTSDVSLTFLRMGKDNTPIDKLFGAIADIIDIRMDLAKIKGLPNLISRDIREQLLSNCHKLEKELRIDWMKFAVCKLNGNFSVVDKSKHGLKLGPAPRFPGDSAYDFKSLEGAKAYMLYWTTLTVIHRTIYETEILMHQHADPKNMLRSATYICRAVSYCMQPRNQMSSAHAVLFAVSQASKCSIVARETEMFIWCQGIYSSVKLNGLDVALQLSEGDWLLWKKGS